MSCTTSSDPTARDFFAGGVDSYLDTITKYAGIGGTEPKLPGYAKLGRRLQIFLCKPMKVA